MNFIMRNESKIHSRNQNTYSASHNHTKSHDCLLHYIAKGFRYSHIRINLNTSKTLEATSFLYALIELLNEKGLLTIEELDKRKKKASERLVKKFVETGNGLMYQDPEYDKYTFEHEAHVDCLKRLQICKAVCCKFPFALSKQDVEEGIIRWEFGHPYLIAHGEDGYCLHMNRETYQCTVRNHRPVPCRGFDCKTDKKWPVWQDFNKKILNFEFLKRFEDGSNPI